METSWRHTINQYISFSTIAWWVLIIAVVILAILAMIFAGLSISESQVYKPNRNLVRADAIFKGDVLVDNDIKSSRVITKTMNVQTLRFQQMLIINKPGWIELGPDQSRVRVDIEEDNNNNDLIPPVVDILLPPVITVPGTVLQIFKSEKGAKTTVNFHVAEKNCLSDFGGKAVSKLNPVYTLLPNQPDAVMLINDEINTWYVLSHS